MDVTSDMLEFYVNGKKIIEPCPDFDMTLVEYLRNKLNIHGPKVACGQGACGSCTVMLSHYDKQKARIINKAVVACLTPLCSVHGCAVTTVEGVGSTRTGLHEIQRRLAEGQGAQCGFCSPGMVMSMYTLLRNQKVTKENIEKALDGNLCRCTGYRPIVQAFQTFDEDSVCHLGKNCCKNKSVVEEKEDGEYHYHYDPSQEPIFPSELQLSEKFGKDLIQFKVGKNVWFRPSSLAGLLCLRKEYPSALLTAGFTQIRLEQEAHVFISLTEVEELKIQEKSPDGIVLGAAVTVNDAIDFIQTCWKEGTDVQKDGFSAVLNLLEKFGSQQIRNMATLGGSLLAKTNNSDVLVALLGVGAQITTIDNDETYNTQPIQDFIEDCYYDAPTGLIVKILIPNTKQDEHIFCSKQAARHAMSRAVVNVGFNVIVDRESREVTKAFLSFGGIGKAVLAIKRTAKAIIGRQWNEKLLEDACQSLTTEMTDRAIGENKTYRITLALGLFFKFYNTVMMRLSGEGSSSVAAACQSSTISGTQVHEEVPADQDPHDPIGRPMAHVSIKQMTTGEAMYYTDIPYRSDEKFVAMVFSTKAHAKVVNVDMSIALSMDGVRGYVDHTDIPGSNYYSGDQADPIFATGEVNYVGHLICGIVADDERKARKAAAAVKVEYQELHHIVSIEEAVAQGSYEEEPKGYSKGNVEDNLGKSDHTVEGTVRLSTQDHFYMESQFILAIPTGECEEYDVYCGTQWPDTTQTDIGILLNIPKNRINVHQKRMGGSFGGKIMRASAPLIAPVVVAAHKYRTAVRGSLTREEDFAVTNYRHPFLINYKASFDDEGNILAVKQDAYVNGGFISSETPMAVDYFAKNVDGAYNVPNGEVKAKICKTNTPTPGAMRGFGQPQSIMACESVINDIADYLGLPAEQIREKNLYKAGDTMITGAKLREDYDMERLWAQLKDETNIDAKRLNIKEFNSQNRFKKRGLAMIPIKYGLGFPVQVMCQGAALVNVYCDGSVTLVHGGTEMGQGINTKMIQVASRELQIPAEKIHVGETATMIVPNASPTGGSMGTDTVGPAVIDACKKITERLEPVKKNNPEGTWETWAKTAWMERISLSATGFFKDEAVANSPHIPPKYHTYGAVCTEVEVDCLTGEHVCLQADMIMDVGKSLNPGIDIGQIEGAFVQGMGYLTMEEMIRSDRGEVLNRSPETYTIPTVADIPRQMNVSLLKGGNNPAAIYSSRGIGEPPYLMASSVFFAIKDAIKACRADNGLKGSFRLDAPATVERIRMACTDRFTQMVDKENDYIPKWYQ